MSKLKIAAITGNRADYGLLKPVLQMLKADDAVDFNLMVTGAHLSPAFGYTIDTIRKDGFEPYQVVDTLLGSQTGVSTAKTVGLGVIGFADALSKLDPDLVLLLGDRFEIMAAVQAAFFLRLPVAHLHGGEITHGAIDDEMRHVITKLSKYHFTTCEQHRQRVIQLGEHPSKVWNVGAPGLEYCRTVRKMTQEEIYQRCNVSGKNSHFLITYHPETAGCGRNNIEHSFSEVLLALAEFEDHYQIFNYANCDEGGQVINRMIDEYIRDKPHCVAYSHFGSELYLNLMREAVAVVGNSSSGIIEAPFYRTPTVNIGMRQRGRLQARSIINARNERADIVQAISTAVSPDFVAGLPEKLSVFGDGFVAEKVISILKAEQSFAPDKEFYDQEAIA